MKGEEFDEFAASIAKEFPQMMININVKAMCFLILN